MRRSRTGARLAGIAIANAVAARSSASRAVAVMALTAAMAATGCNVDLDVSLLDPPDASSGDAASAVADAAGPLSDAAPDVTARDAADGSDGAAADASAATACATDADCKSTSACLTGRCDAARHACVYDLCKQPSACRVAACDRATDTCSVPTTYGFHAGQIKLDRAIGCDGVAARCIAAVAPWIFVGTTSGVVALAASDPTDPSPARVDVGGVPFFPSRIVASGGRVWFIGPVGGGPTSFHVAVAWLDVPADPFAVALTARTAFAASTESAIGPAFAAPGGDLFVVGASGAHLFPIARAAAPLADLGALDFHPLSGLVASLGASPVAASTDRVVAYRAAALLGGGASPVFSLATKVGTSGAQVGAEQIVHVDPTFDAVGATVTLAQAPDGTVAGVFASIAPGVLAGTPGIRATRAVWVLGAAPSVTFTAAAGVDVETYATPLAAGTPTAGPLALVDPTLAVVLAAAHEDAGQTSVQVVTRASASAPATLSATQRFVLPAAPTTTGIAFANGNAGANANGAAWVLAPDGLGGATLDTFAPQCAP